MGTMDRQSQGGTFFKTPFEDFFRYPKAQNYAWGKLGSNSKVAELAHNAEKDFV